jgi:hypothetical protein
MFAFFKTSMPALRPYLIGTRVPSPGVKRTGRAADHSLPSTDEVTNEWRYTFFPLYVPSGCEQRQLYFHLQLTALLFKFLFSRVPVTRKMKNVSVSLDTENISSMQFLIF